MRIIVDAMGGDNAPNEIVAGAVSAAKRFAVEILLVGKEEVIAPLIPEDAKGISIANFTGNICADENFSDNGWRK